MERDYIFIDGGHSQIQIDHILCEVATRNGLSVDELKSKTRAHPIAHTRQEAMYCLRRISLSVVEIGKVFGLDNSTVSYGLQAHCRRKGVVLRGTVAWPLLPRIKKTILKTSPKVRATAVSKNNKPKCRRPAIGTPLADIAAQSLAWQREHGTQTHIKTASR